MWAIVIGFFKQFGGWPVAIFLITAFMVSMIFLTKMETEAEAKVEAAEAKVEQHKKMAIKEISAARSSAKAEIKTVKRANDVQAKINVLDADRTINELRNKWSRD